MKEIRTGKTNEPSAVRTILGWTLFGPYGKPHESNRVLNGFSVKEKLEDKFKQLYSTEFKDPLSRTSSMSVEDRIALSESAYGVAEYTRSENVSRQVPCSLLITKYKVVKPKTEAPSVNKPISTKGASGSFKVAEKKIFDAKPKVAKPKTKVPSVVKPRSTPRKPKERKVTNHESRLRKGRRPL
ncbi:unnamed protein product [Schistosoma mattheei]|uniref:Uncharacterized protein n=1 Tax=Schistosoma mattheei TaxID=31246 RepID=A0A183NSC2_9TREM|nr:unnamed protein product [Schistosoma mattheei]